jgi:hypothetical protein
MNNVTIQSVIDFILSIFGNRLKGYRTKIIAILQVILGVSTFLSNDVATFVCNTFHLACDIQNAKWFGIFLTVKGIIDYILRAISNTPAAPASQFLKRFTGNYKQEVEKLRHQ